MKRRNGPLFWGGFFIALGLLIFLTKFRIIYSDWDFVWSLYPIILVFIGALIIAKDSIIKPFLSAALGIFIALLIYGSISYVVSSIDYGWEDDSDEYSYSYYSEDFDNKYEYGTLNFEGGAGYFTITDTTDKLVDAKSQGSLGDFRFFVSDDENHADITFQQRGKNVTIFKDDFRNRLRIMLNPNPIWDFNLDFGAAKADFDFSEYRIKDIDIESGLSDINLKLGDKFHDTHVRISMGVASLKIAYPKNSGCKITGDMVLFHKVLDNMVDYKRGDNKTYLSKNFEDAENKIYVRIDGGVSKVEVISY